MHYRSVKNASAGAALFILAACGIAGDALAQQGGPGRPPPQVGVVTLHPQSVDLTTELPGRVAAARLAEVRPQVNGIILKRLFEEGAEVKAGQQLYQIDPAPYQAALDTAKAELARAEATANSARTKAARYRDLVRSRAVSQQDYEDIAATLLESEASVAAAKAAIRTAQINLDYTKVTSPIAGRIGRSAMTEGSLVTANQAQTLATVTQLDPIYVDLTQSSAELFRLRQALGKDALRGGTAKAPVRLMVGGGDDAVYAHEGELQFSEVIVDETTGSVRLRAVFPNPNQDLLPGLFVRAKVTWGAVTDAYMVPQQAVIRRPDGSAFVWAVGEDQKATQKTVKAERAIGDKWLVSEGVTPGERVIVEGVQKVAPGAQVSVANVGGPGEQAQADVPSAGTAR
ncbi:efflux RND transporter periplasmic adaptor subunit [Azospirillum sp. SYSU D00513]|uniref:efflux RND transporter periplasmic adaptor subunit n=1 Tax=Azospirillum sp. SYSU D00513 TaxID=2812561 RepID=UPI001A966193|nr:efflux RND transporter periplasmic adaptor subunit [Azospirillum sp. SYSU D00513]